MATPSSPPFPGLLRYKMREKIGSGGMATVYCAADRVLGRDVALKMMHEHLINSPESIRRFASEARAVAALNHENVIKIFDYGEVGSRPYIVMEYVKGVSLQSLLDLHRTLPNLVALEVCRQILKGLACAHSKGIYHRDIKPDNIIIDADGVVKIMDFGIAYIVNQESVTMTGSFIGSPRYISPEQAEGKALTGTTDVFSVGVLLYVALTGALPFNADVAAAVVHSIIHDIPPPVYKRNTAVLYWLSDMVDTFLNKDPGARPASAEGLSAIEKGCLLHGTAPSKERLRRFLDNKEQYRLSEAKELFELYRARARTAAQGRQTAAALKSLEQARAFGPLTKDDERIIASHALKRRVKAASLAALLLLAAGAGLYSLLHFMPARVKNVPATVPDPVAEARPSAREELPRGDGAKPVQVPSANRPFKEKKRRGAPLRDTLAERAAKEHTTITGTIKIQTNPPWAKVYIDNIERGVTPAITLFPVPAGPHDLKIVKEGFPEYRKTLNVSSSDTILVRVQLTP